MNIAIPIHGTRVMPRFGCTREMMIVTIEDGEIVAEKKLTVSLQDRHVLPERLVAEQVSVLICGGIHPRFQQAFQECGIQLIWGAIGEWKDVAQAYVKDELLTAPNVFLCQRRQRHQAHGHGGHRGRDYYAGV